MRRPGKALALGGLLLWTLLVGCGEGDQRPGPAAPSATGEGAAWREIDPPAAAGSLAPNLTVAGEAVLLTWLEPRGDGHRLMLSRVDGELWDEPVVVAQGERFFANWADLPAVAESGDGSLVAHWLAKTAEDTYAYSIFLARSVDGGASWNELGRLNDDDTPTEHGFVSYAAGKDGLRAFWLDGREMETGGPMGLRTAVIGETVGASEVLDGRVCECCSTDAATGAAGPLVVYRDRGEEEVRDVSVVRRRDAGWSEPATAAADGWVIAGCPVNGPATDAAGDRVAVAWYTAVGERPRVQIAFSMDGGATFGPPAVIDGERPLGRVDLVLDEDGTAAVGWFAALGAAAAVRLRLATPAGGLGEPIDAATTSSARASGFPRLVRLDDTLYLAWVDTAPEEGHRIRARAIPLSALPAPR